MTVEKDFPKPLPYNASAALLTLFGKEILRFRKMALHAVLAPILSSLLYLVIFGAALRVSIPAYPDIPYLQFLVPGLVMMTLLQSSFANSAASILEQKLMGTIVYVQLPPFTGLQMALAVMGASALRGLIVGGGVFVTAVLWTRPEIAHPLWVLSFVLMAAMIMAALGCICGLWAERYDQMGAFQTFVIMPLTMLSGTFYSVQTLPPAWEAVSVFNPFFYLTDGLRYGFFSRSDFSPELSLAVAVGAAVSLTITATILFVRGYKIRQ